MSGFFFLRLVRFYGFFDWKCEILWKCIYCGNNSTSIIEDNMGKSLNSVCDAEKTAAEIFLGFIVKWLTYT